MLNPLGGSSYPLVGALFRYGTPAGETDYNDALARETSKPTGEWQTLFIRAVGDKVTTALNGVELLQADNITNASGHIGIQGETGTLEFRSLRIREL